MPSLVPDLRINSQSTDAATLSTDSKHQAELENQANFDTASICDNDSIIMSLHESRIDLADTSRLLESQLNAFLSQRLSNLLQQTDELEKLALWQLDQLTPLNTPEPEFLTRYRPRNLLSPSMSSFGQPKLSNSLHSQATYAGGSPRFYSTDSQGLNSRGPGIFRRWNRRWFDKVHRAGQETVEQPQNVSHRTFTGVGDLLYRHRPSQTMLAQGQRASYVMQLFGEPSSIHPNKFSRFLVEVQLQNLSHPDKPEPNDDFFLILDSGSAITWIRSVEDNASADSNSESTGIKKKRPPRSTNMQSADLQALANTENPLVSQGDQSSTLTHSGTGRAACDRNTNPETDIRARFLKALKWKFKAAQINPVYNPKSRGIVGSAVYLPMTYEAGSIRYRLCQDCLRVGTLPPTQLNIAAAPLNYMSDGVIVSGIEGLLALGRIGAPEEESSVVAQPVCNELLRGFLSTPDALNLYPMPYIVLIGPDRTTPQNETVDSISNTRGHLAVGVLDDSFYTGEISWFPHLSVGPGRCMRSVWMVPLHQVYINSEPLFMYRTTQKALIDTGTSWVLTSSTNCNRIAQIVGGSILPHGVEAAGPSNSFSYPRGAIHSVTFEFGVPGTKSWFSCVVPRSVAELSSTNKDDSQGAGSCWSFIQPSTACTGDVWIIGGIVLERFVTIFDYTEQFPRLGLAGLPQNPINPNDPKWTIPSKMSAKL